MNANKIKSALRHVHLVEQSSTNVAGLHREDAERQATYTHGLNHEERATLRRSLALPEIRFGLCTVNADGQAINAFRAGCFATVAEAEAAALEHVKAGQLDRHRGAVGVRPWAYEWDGAVGATVRYPRPECVTTAVDRTEALRRINAHRIENGEPRLETLPDLETHCEECGTAYTKKDLDGGRCLTCGTMIGAPPTVVQRIYVASFAPSYDEGGIGGFEWRRTRSEALDALSELAKTEGSDLRFIVLDLPNDLTHEQIDDFLSSRAGVELIEPPDPRTDLNDALASWRKETP